MPSHIRQPALTVRKLLQCGQSRGRKRIDRRVFHTKPDPIEKQKEDMHLCLIPTMICRGDSTDVYSSFASYESKKGLVLRSRPMVVGPIWPARTRTSSPNGSSILKIDSIRTFVLPPGRSVRPT